jgi:tetratricopeptide (TPR) repeat protein
LIRGFWATALVAFLFVVAPAHSSFGAQAPSEEGQLDASESLFAVMAAINAAGYDADLDSAANSPLREAVRRAVAAKNPPVLKDLKEYVRAHRQSDWTAELSQYVSFALSVDSPPGFKFRYKAAELPPDVAPLQGFQGLLARFYQEMDLDGLWRQARPQFEQMIARYHQPAMGALVDVNAYLRSSNSPALGTRFQVYVDLLGAPNQIQTRSYKNEYFVVITPSPEPQAEDIRHAYLHFQLDPLAVRYSSELERSRSLIDYAQGAPFLDIYYKSDFLLLATESLIKAVESRLVPPARRQAVVDQALGEGYILTPAWADLLPGYEKQEQSMRFYFPEMAQAINLKREVERLDRVQFATERPVRKAKPAVRVEQKVELSGAARTLADGDQFYRTREFDKARGLYLRVLNETVDRPLQAGAYYGLARIAAFQKDPDTAEKLFEKVVEFSSDPQVKAWSWVYLGRLADAAGDRQQATKRYQSALTIDGASQEALQAARKGLDQAFGPQRPQP